MKQSWHFLLLGLILLSSCINQAPEKEVSFYHWKSQAEFLPAYQEALKEGHSKRVYLHYFDIELVKEPTYYNDGIFPTYVLKSIDKAYSDYDIVPVVYLTNQVLLSEKLDTKSLSEKITKLIHQISERHFGKKINRIQMDCDWTASSKNVYFELLKLLQDEFVINATIRLHQIKYQEKTGIPPVKEGTLMLYNIGDLKDKYENSILESSIVSQYINTETDYPMPLKLGLPLFSQTVVFNKTNEVKIIRNTEKEILKSDAHFKQIDETNFLVKKDTLYKGFYLSKGYALKLEQLQQSEVIDSYQQVLASKLNIDEVIFYHLDETSLKNISLQEIIDQL